MSLQRVNNKTCTSLFFFICHKTEDGIRSYIFVPESKTWSEAHEHCRRNGYHLAGLEDSDLNTAVREQDFPVWTGLHRDGKALKSLKRRKSDVELLDVLHQGSQVSVSTDPT